MKCLKLTWIFSGVMGLWMAFFPCFSQGQDAESYLPKDHILEDLSWWSEGGKVEVKGLFAFEKLSGSESKDLIFVYRPQVPVAELDKPHTQTLAVYFYNPSTKKRVKGFEDEGGPIQWIKVLKDPGSSHVYLILQRSDLKGNQVVKGFMVIHGEMKQVLEGVDSQSFVNFPDSSKPLEIWCSSKGFPGSKGDAEHVFAWDESLSRFQDEKVIPENPGSWSGFSVVIATPVVVAQKPEPVPQNPTPVTGKSATYKSMKGWWDEPLDPAVAFIKLKTEFVPQGIQNGQIAVVGQQANAFFKEIQKKGVQGQEFASMRSSYYAAVASALLDKGNLKDAAYYLKIALSFQTDNPDAVALKTKIKP